MNYLIFQTVPHPMQQRWRRGGRRGVLGFPLEGVPALLCPEGHGFPWPSLIASTLKQVVKIIIRTLQLEAMYTSLWGLFHLFIIKQNHLSLVICLILSPSVEWCRNTYRLRFLWHSTQGDNIIQIARQWLFCFYIPLL